MIEAPLGQAKYYLEFVLEYLEECSQKKIIPDIKKISETLRRVHANLFKHKPTDLVDNTTSHFYIKCWACGTEIDFGEYDTIIDVVGEIRDCPICGAKCMAYLQAELTSKTQPVMENYSA